MDWLDVFSIGVGLSVFLWLMALALAVSLTIAPLMIWHRLTQLLDNSNRLMEYQWEMLRLMQESQAGAEKAMPPCPQCGGVVKRGAGEALVCSGCSAVLELD